MSENELNNKINELLSKIELSHQSQAKIASQAWGEMKNEIKNIRKNLEDMYVRVDNLSTKFDEFETSVKISEQKTENYIATANALKAEYDSKVAPNINTWTSTSETIKWVTRIIIGAVVVALLALIIKQ